MYNLFIYDLFILLLLLLLLLFILFLFLGIRLIDSGSNLHSTDAQEAQALSFKPNYIDIYSNSWGPSDTGAAVEGPGHATEKALEHGAKNVSSVIKKRRGERMYPPYIQYNTIPIHGTVIQIIIIPLGRF